MKLEYHNLYTHFILITQNRVPSIPEKNRQRIEKYITSVINNNHSKLYSIYANPEHVHILAFRSSGLSEEILATIVADSTLRFINNNKLSSGVSKNTKKGHKVIRLGWFFVNFFTEVIRWFANDVFA